MIGNAESLSKGNGVSFSAFVTLSDFTNHLFGKFVKFVSFATATSRSALCNHVSHVVRVCPKPEMIWIGALGSVACVANAKSIRNVSVVNNPRGNVCFDCSMVSKTVDLPVSVRGSSGHPKPAGIGLVYTFPKTFLEVVGKALRIKSGCIRFGMHIKRCLMCRALGCFCTAEAFS